MLLQHPLVFLRFTLLYFNREGLWEEIQSQICSLANRLAVHISGCKDKPIIPMKVIRASDYSYQDQYPITPGTVERPAE